MKKKGIHLRTLSYYLMFASLVIGLVSIFGMVNVYSKYKGMLISSSDYGNARDSIYNLKEGSDYLTEQVRQYAITGNRAYMENYFYEADVRRRRDTAVEEMINDIQVGTATVDALRRALAESNRLMDTEFHSMKLVAYAYAMAETDMPVKVEEWKLTENELEMSKTELIAEARKLVFDADYASAKESITKDLSEAMGAVESGMKEHMDSSAKLLEGTLVVQLLLTLALIFLSAGAVAGLIIFVIAPLDRYDENIINGEPLEMAGSVEFRKLAETYNTILAQNRESRKRLKYKAEHDELTKLLNRTAFDKLCDSLAKEDTPFALLIIDVDNFKKINDTYGHAKGDEALLRVGNRLMGAFRSDDYCVRYGGDEFVVLMTGVSPASAGTIVAKIEEINDELKQGGTKDTPSVTLSVGISFSEKGYTSGLFANADKALYFTKENGRSGYTFYDDVEMNYHAA
ncbi:MAG: GGDEF domain-containing protein [Lachnospiraceae bacterium]|nr:GGDEF domain-containing protein [Lachnospiraceae bacterium]